MASIFVVTSHLWLLVQNVNINQTTKKYEKGLWISKLFKDMNILDNESCLFLMMMYNEWLGVTSSNQIVLLW